MSKNGCGSKAEGWLSLATHLHVLSFEELRQKYGELRRVEDQFFYSASTGRRHDKDDRDGNGEAAVGSDGSAGAAGAGAAAASTTVGVEIESNYGAGLPKVVHMSAGINYGADDLLGRVRTAAEDVSEEEYRSAFLQRR